MKNSKKGRRGRKGTPAQPMLEPQLAPPSDAMPLGERRRRPRHPDPMDLFDHEAATDLRTQFAALAEELDRSRTAEVLVAERSELLAASLAEMQRALDVSASSETSPTQPEAPVEDLARAHPTHLVTQDESAALLRAQLASLVADLESSRLAEALAVRQAQLLSASLEHARRMLESAATSATIKKRGRLRGK